MYSLNDFKIYVINPLEQYQHRYDYMIDFLKKIGIKDENITHYKSSINPNYTNELKKSTINILKDNNTLLTVSRSL